MLHDVEVVISGRSWKKVASIARGAFMEADYTEPLCKGKAAAGLMYKIRSKR